MQSEFPIRGKLFAASLVKKFHATNVPAEFFIKISSRASPPRGSPRSSSASSASPGLLHTPGFYLPPPPHPPFYPVAEKFHIETYGIGRNPHGSKYIPMGFLSDLIRSYPVTYLSILSGLIRYRPRKRGTLLPISTDSHISPSEIIACRHSFKPCVRDAGVWSKFSATRNL